MSTSNIGKGAIISYIAIVLNLAISFLYTPWMLKQIGVSDYGLYSLIISFISYFIMDFGLSSAIARFIAKYRAEGDLQKISNILGITTKVFLSIDFIIFLILFVCYFFITDIFKGLTPEEVEKLKVLYVIAGSFSVLSFALKPMDGAMTAFEFFVPNKLLDMAHKVGVVLLVVIALTLQGDVYALVFINGATAFLTSLAKFFYWKRKSAVSINIAYFEKSELKSIFAYSGWTFLRGLAQRFRLSLIPSVLGVFANSGEIAIFALGITLEGMTWNLSSAMNGLFLPKLSRLAYQGKMDEINKLMVKVGRLQLFIVLLILSGLYTFGRQFINLWVGEQFSDVYIVLIALTITYVLSNTMRIADDMVYVNNLMKYTTSVTFLWSALGLIGSCIVASRYGAAGCAICSGTALILNQFNLQKVYRTKLGLDTGAFFRECHFRIMPLLVILSAAFMIVVNMISVESWFLLIAIATVYVVLYMVISYCVLFNEYEKDLFNKILKIKQNGK